MATRSRIGKMMSDGNVKSIYCHFDGYPNHNGKILKEHYTDESKIDQLIELGDLSYLGNEIGEKQDFNNISNPNWCKAYGRDRDEENTQAEISTFTEMLTEQYSYVYDSGQWRCFDYKGKEIML